MSNINSNTNYCLSESWCRRITVYRTEIIVFNEDGTGKTIENSGTSWTGNFTRTLDGRNLTTTYSYGADYEKDYYYIRKLTANEMELYHEEDEDSDEDGWWCEVYVRTDKEL